MRCPFCGNEDTRVTDSRPVEESNSIRRRRQCDQCGKRFTTYEKIETIPLVVVKKDDTRQQYDRTKIVPVTEIEAMIDRVEGNLYNRQTSEVRSSEIGELVMDALKDLDAVAYVRFASVYREFKDVGTFMEELKKIIQ